MKECRHCKSPEKKVTHKCNECGIKQLSMCRECYHLYHAKGNSCNYFPLPHTPEARGLPDPGPPWWESELE